MNAPEQQLDMIAIGTNAEPHELAGPLVFAGISFDDDYTVMLRDAAGRCAEIPVNDLARDDTLVSRLRAIDALRIGTFRGEWSTRRRIGELPRAA